MPGKLMTLELNTGLQQTLCEAVRLYAEAAYPPGGSECAQVARESLLSAASSIDEQCADTGYARVSRRLRTQLKSALEYFTEVNAANGNDVSGQVEQLRAILASNAKKLDEL